VGISEVRWDKDSTAVIDNYTVHMKNGIKIIMLNFFNIRETQSFQKRGVCVM
jgi:hypothetical protein